MSGPRLSPFMYKGGDGSPVNESERDRGFFVQRVGNCVLR
jgi:hypothetical protein